MSALEYNVNYEKICKFRLETLHEVSLKAGCLPYAAGKDRMKTPYAAGENRIKNYCLLSLMNIK